MSDIPAPVACGCSTPQVDSSWRGRLARLPRAVPAIAIIAPIVIAVIVGQHWVGAALGGLGLLAFAVVIAATWTYIGTVERLLRVAVFMFATGLVLVRVIPT